MVGYAKERCFVRNACCYPLIDSLLIDTMDKVNVLAELEQLDDCICSPYCSIVNEDEPEFYI